MACKCQVCGEEMVYKVGEHYRHTKGMVLYRGRASIHLPPGMPGCFL